MTVLRTLVLAVALVSVYGCSSAPDPSGVSFPEIERWWR